MMMMIMMMMMMMLCCCDRGIDIRVDSVSSSATAVDIITDSIAVSSFDIDDMPVTLRTRPTRAKHFSAMLRPRSISQDIVSSRILPRATSALSRLLTKDSHEESYSKDKTSPTLFSQCDRSPEQSAGQNVSPSDDVAAHLSSTNLAKLSSSRRSRASFSRTDAVESPSTSPYNDLVLKTESEELRPMKAEKSSPTLSLAVSPVTTSVEALSTRVSTLNTSAELIESSISEAVTSRISPIARNNQTLLQHLKRPSVFRGVQPNTVDVKKLRMSPVGDVKSPPTMDGWERSSPHAGETKAGHSPDQLSVTLNPPSRQPLSVKTDSSNTATSSCGVSTTSSPAVAAKSKVVSPGFVSHFCITTYNNCNGLFFICDFVIFGRELSQIFFCALEKVPLYRQTFLSQLPVYGLERDTFKFLSFTYSYYFLFLFCQMVNSQWRPGVGARSS